MSLVEGKNKELVRKFSTGETILREGDSSKDMFIIQTGKVKVIKKMAGHDIELGTLEKTMNIHSLFLPHIIFRLMTEWEVVIWNIHIMIT